MICMFTLWYFVYLSFAFVQYFFLYIYIFILLFLFLQQLFATMLKYQILTPIFINKMESVAIYLRYKFLYSEVICTYVST